VAYGGLAAVVAPGVVVASGVPAAAADGASVARASVWWRTSMVEVVERTTGGLMYAAALSARPEEAAPETRVG